MHPCGECFTQDFLDLNWILDRGVEKFLRSVLFFQFLCHIYPEGALAEEEFCEGHGELAGIRLLLKAYEECFESDIPCFTQLLEAGFIADKVPRAFQSVNEFFDSTFPVFSGFFHLCPPDQSEQL